LASLASGGLIDGAAEYREFCRSGLGRERDALLGIQPSLLALMLN
jgi:hypothetical protein